MLNTDLQLFWDAHATWSRATFGDDSTRGPRGPLKHLQKEAAEASREPGDIKEFADILLLFCDSTRLAGFTCEQVMAAAWSKLEENKSRKWPSPPPQDTGEPIEHVRE